MSDNNDKLGAALFAILGAAVYFFVLLIIIGGAVAVVAGIAGALYGAR